MDKIKNQLARAHGYVLIRIPYTKFNTMETYLVYKISVYYKYRVGSKFYKGFTDLCQALHLPGNTKPIDVKQYLTYTKLLS